MLLGPPKSRAGRRTVSVPASILPILRQHLVDFVGEEPIASTICCPRSRAWPNRWSRVRRRFLGSPTWPQP